jgi:hypothetical protein
MNFKNFINFMNFKNFKLTLLFILAVLAVGFTTYKIADYRLSIGPAYIRYDADSNILKIGHSNGSAYPKIGCEYNAPLFNYNHEHFTWTNSGLSLLPHAIGDSIPIRQLTIYYDTTVGEQSYYKYYTLKQQDYNVDSLAGLFWIYKETKWNNTKKFYAINNLELLEENSNTTELTTTLTEYYAYLSPHPGLWKYTFNFDVEFEYGHWDNAPVPDSIYILITLGRDLDLSHWVRMSVVQDYYGEKLSGNVTVILPETSAFSDSVRFRAICSSNASVWDTPQKKYIKYFRAERELIR